MPKSEEQRMFKAGKRYIKGKKDKDERMTQKVTKQADSSKTTRHSDASGQNTAPSVAKVEKKSEIARQKFLASDKGQKLQKMEKKKNAKILKKEGKVVQPVFSNPTNAATAANMSNKTFNKLNGRFS